MKNIQLIKNIFLFSFFLANTPLSIFAQKPLRINNLTLIDSFQNTLDTALWYAECDPRPHNSVAVKDGHMEIDVAHGATIWLKRPLSKNWEIEFDRVVVLANGKNDRLSDFNLFWQATDPRGTLFGRNPKFENYDSLSLYYVGIGGNTNTTTRFRKYQGTGEKTILKEYLDTAHLLKANHAYHCRLVFRKNQFWFYLNNDLVFHFKDKKPLKKGYFGFRTTQSRHRIDNFKLTQRGNVTD